MIDANFTQKQQIETLKKANKELRAKIKSMAEINADAAEIVAELEAKKEEVSRLNKQYSKSNSELARANAQAAELMAEIEDQRAQLSKQNERLTLLNDEKNELLGMVSHDILSGIAVIGFQNEMLIKSLPNVDENFLKGLYRIHKYVRHISELVNDSLNIAKIEEGKMEPHFEEQSLEELLKDTVDLYSLAAKDKQQTLTLEIDQKYQKFKWIRV
ncbi:MAG: histidine kinase dimerization/phospho-acceptor domain-containing protein [Pseudomonadota bacterium]